MACSTEFIESICSTLAPLGEVRSRKMMGDYVIYLNGKCVITACDNVAYVKKLPCIAELMAGAECGCPYQGAKEAYILDLTDTHKTLKVLESIWEVLPFPKSMKKQHAISIESGKPSAVLKRGTEGCECFGETWNSLEMELKLNDNSFKAV